MGYDKVMLEESGPLYQCSWDLFESSMVRPADQETSAAKEEVFTHRPLCGGNAPHAGPHGEVPGLGGKQE